MLPTTKTMISEAFLEMSKGKSIDKITVRDIVETCSITRQTFYYHFQDIMDVIEWSLQQKMEDVLNRSLQTVSMQDAIKILISNIIEFPEIINKLMSSQKRDQTERLLIVTIRTYLQVMIEKKELFMDVKRSDMEMAVNFYSYAITGILLEISHNRKSIDLDIVSRQIFQLISGEMLRSQNF